MERLISEVYVSIVLWITVAVFLIITMFFIRESAQQLILQISYLLKRQLRLMSKWCESAYKSLQKRNFQVTKALEEELLQRRIERDFLAVEGMVVKDLSHYQSLAADIMLFKSDIDADYSRSGEVPPPQPDWLAALESVSELEKSGDRSKAMVKILADMRKTVEQHHKEVMREYRWTVGRRHKVLAGLQPQLRKLSKLFSNIDNKAETLSMRLKRVDQHMSHYEQLLKSNNHGFRSSLFVRFFFASLFLSVSIVAAVCAAAILSPSISSLFDGKVLGLPLAQVLAALMVSMLVVATALITESLRITRMFPLLMASTRRGRRVLTGTGVVLLCTIFGTAMSLATQGMLYADFMQMGASQIITGLVLCALLLAAAAGTLSLEYVVTTARPIFGTFAQLSLQVTAFMMRALSSLAGILGKIIVLVYDVIIFIPLRIAQELNAREPTEFPAIPQGELSKHVVEAENIVQLGSDRK